MTWLTNPYRFGIPDPDAPFAQATITIVAGKVSSNLTGVPVRVLLADMPSGFWSAVASDGGDIRVKQGGTDLPVDIVYIDTGTEIGEIFFLADLLTGSDNVFILYAGSGAAEPAASDPTGRYAVWAGYERILRLSGPDTLGGGVADVTACAFDRATGTAGTNNGLSNGISADRDFVSGGSGAGHVYISASHLSDWTIAAVVRSDGAGSGGQDFSYFGSADGNDFAIVMGNNASNLGSLIAGSTNYNAAYAPVAGSYHFIGMQSESDVVRLIVDGVVSSNTRASSRPTTGNQFRIGPSFGTTNTEYTMGYIKSGVVPAARLAAEAAAWVAPGSFYAVTP